MLDLNHGSGAVYGRGDVLPTGAEAVTALVNAHIDAALLQRRGQQTPRDYLGGSRVGDAVLRGEKLRNVLQGLFADITRLALRRAVTEPLVDTLSGVFGGAGGAFELGKAVSFLFSAGGGL
jgi:hypothetical protein